jgi:O-antigen/teichoic acid export membrane protein
MWREWSKRFLWLSLGSLVGRLLPYAMLVWLGRRLDSSGFATLGIAFAWTAVSASLTTSGLSYIAAQRLATIENPGEACSTFRRIAVFGVFLSCSLAAIVLVVDVDRVVGFFGQSIDPGGVAPALLSGAAWSLVMLAVAAFNGLHAAKQAASLLSLGGVFQGVGLALGLFLGQGQLGSILWGFAGGNAVAFVFALWRLSSLPSLREGCKQTPSNAPPVPLGPATAWVTLAAASVTPVSFAAGAIISNGPDGVLQLARFHALEQLHQLAIYLPNVMSVAMLPVLSRQSVTQDGRLLRDMIKVAWLVAMAGTATALVLAWNPAWLHQLIGNPALNDAAATRTMLMHAALAPSLGMLGSAILARGKFALAALLNVAWATVFLGVTWLCREEGAAGVQAARLLASGLLLVVLSVALWIIASTLRLASQEPTNRESP